MQDTAIIAGAFCYTRAPMHEAAFVPARLWIAPFALLLAAIAILPLATPRLWHSNARKLALSALLGLPVVLLYLRHHPVALVETARDYVSFIVLLASLFVISGGIVARGDLRATPAVNTAFLGTGAVLASFIGTTGAAMLLIRPLLDTNAERRRVHHTVIFFIFVVANIGGCLTPLGDPPLFLGYLAGVPFRWTLRLFPMWLFTNGVLLVVYYLWDRREFGREAPRDRERDLASVRPLRLSGLVNVPLLLGVVARVARLGAPYRELAMIALAVASWRLTAPEVRRENRFSFHPILEVAAVFAGIFATMIPALDVLRAEAPALGIREPWHFFWATGALSSFLDNAPTYLVFLAVARGAGLAPEVAGVSHAVLVGISLGAVFMGANTYIGNGPNFMVRSIAEERGVRMPSFGGYMLVSGAVLLPLFALVTLVFLR